jgi:ankyrin repeat protein
MSEHKEEFINAVKAGDTAKVCELLAGNGSLAENINAPWFGFDTPAIVQAAGQANRAMVDLLLERGADINAKSSWWAGAWGVLHHAAQHGDADLAAFLIERDAVVDAHAAAGLGMMDKLTELVAAHPSVVNEPGPDGMTPLHFAATPQIAEFLLNHGADLNARDKDHNGTPAQWAVSDRPDVCQFLIERGAEADICLLVALGDVERVQAALQANPAAVNARTDGEAPGGHINAYTGVGSHSTPLITAARFNQVEIAKLLLDAGADIAARGQHGGIALHWAAWHGHVEMVNQLLERGAPVDVTDEEFDSTPLGWAAHGSANCRNPQGDYVAVVERLIAAGANVPEKAGGSEAVAEALRRRGAQ